MAQLGFSDLFEGFNFAPTKEKKEEAKKEEKKAKAKEKAEAKKDTKKEKKSPGILSLPDAMQITASADKPVLILYPPFSYSLTETKKVSEIVEHLKEAGAKEAEDLKAYRLNVVRPESIVMLLSAKKLSLTDNVGDVNKEIGFGQEVITVPEREPDENGETEAYKAGEILDAWKETHEGYAAWDGLREGKMLYPWKEGVSEVAIGEYTVFHPVTGEETKVTILNPNEAAKAILDLLPANVKEALEKQKNANLQPVVENGSHLAVRFLDAQTASATAAYSQAKKMATLPTFVHFTFGQDEIRFTPEDFGGKTEVEIDDLDKKVMENCTALKDAKHTLVPGKRTRNGVEENVVQVMLMLQSKGLGIPPYGEVKDHLVLALRPGAIAEDHHNMVFRVWHGDIIQTVYIPIPTPGGLAKWFVTDNVITEWGITPETLFADAEESSPRNREAALKPLPEVIKKLSADYDLPIPEELPEESIPEGAMPWVAGAMEYPDGAAVVTYPGFLKEAAEKLGGDFYLIPSSIHEFLLLPYHEEESEEYLKWMVYSINRDVHNVGQDFLSDCILFYDAEKDSVREGRKEEICAE